MRAEPTTLPEWLDWWGERMLATGREDAASAVNAAAMKTRQMIAAGAFKPTLTLDDWRRAFPVGSRCEMNLRGFNGMPTDADAWTLVEVTAHDATGLLLAAVVPGADDRAAFRALPVPAMTAPLAILTPDEMRLWCDTYAEAAGICHSDSVAMERADTAVRALRRRLEVP